MHPRAQIRSDFKTALTDRTAAEARVFTSRLAPISLEMLKNEGPVILVYAVEETIDPDDYPISGTDGAVRRMLDVAVEGIAIGTKEVDDALDALAAEIEQALEDFAPGAFPSADVKLTSTELDISEAFERPVGSVVLNYRLRYFTEYRRDDSTFLPDDVYSASQRDAPEIIVDGPGNDA